MCLSQALQRDGDGDGAWRITRYWMEKDSRRIEEERKGGRDPLDGCLLGA